MWRNHKKAGVIISVILVLLTAASGCSLLLSYFDNNKSGFVAEIYQEGRLLFSIPLNQVTEMDSFVIEGKNGCTNKIEVRPGSIGIVSADCPDKLCVRQGFITDSRLPVICLPNRLVIRLRPVSDADRQDSETLDIITY